LWGITLILFGISQVIPADPAKLLVGEGQLVTPEFRANLEHKLGLDQPLPVQYWRYLVRLAHGDLGQSIRYGQPVGTLLRQGLPATFTLVAAGTLLAIVVGFPLGFAAAKFRDTWVDAFVRGFAMVGTSVPSFYLAILLIYFFGYYLGWFPIAGEGSPPDIAHLVLPSVVLGYSEMGHFVRILRASLLDELGEDHIRAARGRGIGERSILLKHAGRNSLGPTITVLGLSVANLAGQVILIETVFGWPGIGNLIQLGILWNDFPLVTGALIVLLTYTVVVVLFIDIILAVVDPRLRSANA
jgi:peptide/nickel transport system permease protein